MQLSLLSLGIQFLLSKSESVVYFLDYTIFRSTDNIHDINTLTTVSLTTIGAVSRAMIYV